MKSILVVAFLSSVAHAFRPLSFPRFSLIALRAVEADSPVDWKRAQHCAENFGACDVDEVEELYQSKCSFRR